MRGDMAKVVVERPRTGGHGARRGRACRDVDLLPKRKGLQRAALEKGDRKQPSDYLAPLRRYLLSQVGRPWNKVWSEICGQLRPTSTMQQHVRDHVFDFVAVRGVHIRDGEIYIAHPWGPTRPLRESWIELWVDPRTGILRRNRNPWSFRKSMARKRQRHEAALRQRMVAHSDVIQYHLLDDGAWWAITLSEVPTTIQPRTRSRSRYPQLARAEK